MSNGQANFSLLEQTSALLLWLAICLLEIFPEILMLPLVIVSEVLLCWFLLVCLVWLAVLGYKLQVRIIWDAGTSAEEMRPSEQTVRESEGHFLD